LSARTDHTLSVPWAPVRGQPERRVGYGVAAVGVGLTVSAYSDKTELVALNL